MPIYFVYTVGNFEDLALYELTSVLETYDVKYKFLQYLPQTVILNADKEIEDLFAKRIAFSHILVKLLFSVRQPNLSEIIHQLKVNKDKLFPETNFSFQSKRVQKAIPNINGTQLMSEITKKIAIFTKSKVSYKTPKVVYFGLLTSNMFLFGYIISESNRKEVLMRGPKYRKYNHPATLSSDLSRLLVNFAHLKEDKCLIDPFCGIGSILIEGSTANVFSIGMDVDKWMVYRAKKNLEFFNCEKYALILGNALSLPVKNNFSIVTDPPYGKAASAKGEKINIIYKKFIEGLMSFMKKKNYLVLLSPHYISVSKYLTTFGFQVVKRFYVYYHSKLTRVITVAYFNQ